jgi:hypothetical protein
MKLETEYEKREIEAVSFRSKVVKNFETVRDRKEIEEETLPFLKIGESG